MASNLFDPLTLGSVSLSNRVVMAPLTRCRAEEGAVPGPLMAEYYVARADAGLIIAESTAISPQAYGWGHTPGIWNDEQVRGWKQVTDAVHAKGGKIFLQLWHTGRVSHPDFLEGETPVGPSAIAAQGKAYTPQGEKPFVEPRALSREEIGDIVGDFASAARRAMAAGFDGVEIHAANGYLIDQFIRDGSNRREDEYGGSIDNRLRFLTEVTKAVSDAVGADKVGVRLSPQSTYNDMRDSDPAATFTRAAEILDAFGLAYLHTLEPVSTPARVTPQMRRVFKGPLITNGGFDAVSADQAVRAGEADAIAFGVAFIANPDLVTRFSKSAALNAPDTSTYYTPGPKGYTDYPRLDERPPARRAASGPRP